MSGHEDKAKRYIELLEAARVKGSWSELPELIRKVTKHAPKQTTLIQTVTAEHFVASHIGQGGLTASRTPDSSIETLRQTVDNAQNPLAEENFQGKTCLTWAASAGLISSSEDSFNTADTVALFDRYGQKGTSTWTKISLLKAVYIQGRRHAQRTEEQQAQYIWKTAVAWIELYSDAVRSVPQLAYWAEQIQAEYATSQSNLMSVDERLKALQIWSTLTSKSQEVSSSTFGNAIPHKARGAVWRIYYDTLSQSLAESQRNASTTMFRSQQASQLRAVESAYETVFLRNRKFPKATESNAPVEDWVEQVIRNWHIVCGPGWPESELGEGGRNAVTRNVLDVLYRAATKTFHSTLILRRLFQVHKSLTEFDLAYRCLDTYIELVERARARSAKTQEPDPNQDSDEIMLLVVAEGIEGLCAFGRQQEAQKAYNIAEKVEDWLAQILPEEQPDAVPNGHAEPVHAIDTRLSEGPSDEALQIVYRGIGIAKAHWARWTPSSGNRSELQSEAMVALQKACSLSEPQLPTLYALAVLCAETRDIPQAIHATKVALERISRSDTQSAKADQERTAFWHLMTLLLSSQQDFETALQVSGATLDQMLSSSSRSERFQSEARSQSGEKHNKKLEGYTADDLECDDLQRLIELQISYLALIELIDGPETALNHSNDLLSLYSILFKRFEVGEPKTVPDQTLAPPKTSAGTIKSVRGSIFSRRKGAASSIAPSAATASLKSASPTARTVRPGTQASEAPTIQVTDETGKAPTRKHHHLPLHHKHKNDASKASQFSKPERPGTASTIKATSTLPTIDGTSSTDFGDVKAAAKAISPTGYQHDEIAEAKQPIGEVPHNLDIHDNMPPPPGHKDQPPEQDIRLPTVHSHTTSTSPMPRFAKAAAQKHALVVLNKIWLTTSTLYRRSHIFEDAKEATEEAAKAASRIEALVSAIDPSARALAEAGWGGGGRSADEVWADVYCSRAELLLAIAKRREEEGQSLTSESLQEVVDQYEQCLMYYPNHANGIIGLSNILLDYYEKKIDLAKRVDDGRSLINPSPTTAHVYNDPCSPDAIPVTAPGEDYLTSPFSPSYPTTSPSDSDLRKTPSNLNRIAARDRAYGLLSTLTKLGTGWDNSEAWFALARAHELGGEVDRAKEILWWVIELEETRPVRNWGCLGVGGYVL